MVSQRQSMMYVKKTMGGVGIALAMLGVIACPITSGDTAFKLPD